MAITEKTYKDMLKETVMLKHVGSGPKDPAPEENETKSPVEDSKGEGTQQAGTKDPNKIPSVSALKKELAKEGIVLNGKTPKDIIAELRALPDKLQPVAMRKVKELFPIPK